jgi:FixJ family two-component response regulator
MPELNGDQLAALVKQRSPGIPVIMITGFADIMDATSERPAGIDRLIGKPLNLKALREAIVELSTAKGGMPS